MRIRAVACQVTCGSIVRNLSPLDTCSHAVERALACNSGGPLFPVVGRFFFFNSCICICIYEFGQARVTAYTSENNLRCPYLPSALWITVVSTKPAGSQLQESPLSTSPQERWGYPRAASYPALCLCSGDLNSGSHTRTRGARFISLARPRSTLAKLKRTPMSCLTVWRLEAHSKPGQAALYAGSRGGQPPPIFASSQSVVVASSPR